MRIEDHLLGLARIGTHKWHASVAEADVSDLDGDRCAIEHNDLMAPIELVGFARSKAQRDVRYGRRLPVRLAPSPKQSRASAHR